MYTKKRPLVILSRTSKVALSLLFTGLFLSACGGRDKNSNSAESTNNGGGNGGTATTNASPTANVGSVVNVTVNNSVHITGSGTDSDGEIVAYQWSEDGKVLGTSASLSYTATIEGKHVLTLTVTDNNNATGTDTLHFTAKAPVVNIPTPNKPACITLDALKNQIKNNEDVTQVNTSCLTDMSALFYKAKDFNQDIGGWDVSKVKDMRYMFEAATSFNQDISNWDVSNVTEMGYMFYSAKRFNQPIGRWKMSSVTSISGMFSGALAFNQTVSDWDVSNVTSMFSVFSGASAFSDQDLRAWDVSKVNSRQYFMKGVGVGNTPPNWDDQDKTAPVISVNGGDVTIEQDASYTDAGATAVDNIDGELEVVVTGSVDTATIAKYTITYTATDAAGNSSTATRTVTVIAKTPQNHAPVVIDLQEKLKENVSTHEIILLGTDVDGDNLVYSLITEPTHGSVVISGNKASYTPRADYFGLDSFIYKANDGITDSNNATVRLIISSTNKAPTANAGADTSVQVNTPVALTATATDIDGTITRYVWKEDNITLATTAVFDYTPKTEGEHTLTLTVTDNEGTTATDQVIVTATATPNLAPTANAGKDTTVQLGKSVTLTGSGVDTDGTIASHSWSENGAVIATTAGFEYTPTTQGSHTLTLTVTDNDGATATDDINITVTLAAPYQIIFGTNPVKVARNIQTSLFTQTLQKITSVIDGSGNPVATEPTFDPNVVDLSTPGTYPVEFSYTDPYGRTISNTLLVIVENYAPVAVSASITVDEDSVNNPITLVASDANQWDTLTYIVNQPSHGTVSGTFPNVTYSPVPNYAGSDSFTFTVNDGIAESTGTISITVTDLPEPQGAWLPAGMGGGGGIELPSISPHDKNTVMITTDMSGVYKTQNFGKDWGLLPFKTAAQKGITDRGGSSPIQFTSDSNVIYANHRDTYPKDDFITEDINSPEHIRYVVKSTDAGKTFNRLKAANTQYSSQVYADPASSKRLILRAEINGEMQVLYSNDGGDSFVSIPAITPVIVPTDDPNAPDLVLHVMGAFWNGDEVVIATNGGLYVSNSSDHNKVAFKKVTTAKFNNPAKESLTTFSSAKDAQGNISFFAVTYPTSLGWSINYPRNPSYVVEPVDEPTDKYTFEDISVYRMDWEKPPLLPTWETVNYTKSDFIPFWVGTARNDIKTVYLAGIDRNPWLRPAVIKNTQGAKGDKLSWTSVLLTDACQGNDTCDGNNDPKGWRPPEPNKNIRSGWGSTDGLYNTGEGVNEITWGWSPDAEGFAVDPNDSSRIILSTNALFSSENGGDDWTQIYNKQDNQNDFGAIPQHDSNKRYKSNGMEPTVTWWMEWLNNNDVVAAQTDVKGMLSNDDGISWRSLANTLPNENTYKITKSIDGKNLFAATAKTNDYYLDHYRMRDLEDATVNISTCLADNNVAEESFRGAISQSDFEATDWKILQKFQCPVVWVEVDKTNPKKLYASVIHSKHGGIYVTEDVTAAKPLFTLLSKGPSLTKGNPNNIIALNNGDLLASWSVKFDHVTGKAVGSGVFKWVNSTKKWLSYTQPKSMDKWTRDVVKHPTNDSVWFASSYNQYDKFNTPSKSNLVINGGGGIFRYSNNGAVFERITPEEIYRADSISINPNNTDEAYVTTQSDGLWKTVNLNAPKPLFERVTTFNYRHPLRVFYSPVGKPWVTTFGGGVFYLK